MGFKKFMALILCGGIMLVGCSILPSPGSTIKAPRVANAEMQKKEDATDIAKKFLPAGAELIEPGNPEKVGAVRVKDLDGDSQDEILATYKAGENPGEVGAFALKEKQGEWQKAWEQKGLGYALDLVDFADILGDGRPEVLMGGTIGASAGNGLSIFQWQGDTLKKIASSGYHKLEILQPEEFPGAYGVSDKATLAIWQKDTGTAMMVDVLRWYEIGLMPAEDLYPQYFPKVVEYYQQQLKEMPDAPFLWYYLGDAQQKAGQPENAIKSIEKGLSLKGEYPSEYEFEMVKGKALNQLGEYEKAIDVFNDILEVRANVPKPAGGQQPEEPAFLKRIKAEAMLNMGKSYQGLKQYDKAEDHYRQSMDMTQSLFKDGSHGQASNDQLLAAFPASRALLRLKGIKGYERINQYLAALKPEDRWQKLNYLDEWGKEQNMAINHFEAETEMQDGGLPQTLLLDFATDPASMGAADGHAIFWWDDDRLHSQVFYSADEDAHGFSQTFTVINARLSPGENNAVEMGAVYDSATGGSGSPVPVYKVLRLGDDGKWRTVWSSPKTEWYNSHGRLTFAGHGISEIILEGDSWLCGDGKDEIFHESNPGPHRYFQSTWARQGDGYVLKENKVIPSAYNTLVEFVYALSTGQDAEAEKWVADKALVEKAKQMELVQNPLGQSWMLAFKDSAAERLGPLKIESGPAEGVEISFIEKDGQFLISKINK